MGVAAAVVGAVTSIAGNILSSNKAKNAQRDAEVAAREAAKRNVTVRSSGEEPVRTETENVEAGETSRQNARKRRQGIASTLSKGGLTSSLVGNKSLLGG